MSRLFALVALLGLAAPLSAASTLPKAPPGFRVELVLEAPAIEAPTALCVAPNGDVYFAEDPMDMRGPPTKPLDKIWLLRGGDPNKKILFADKMWAVMGLEIVRDKLYVVHAPHVTVFTLDANGQAKERTELFDDLGPPVAGVPSFNDHIPSGIRMGMDGWLYVSIGDKGIPKMSRIPSGGRKPPEPLGSVHVAEGRWRHTKEGHHISLEGGGVIRFRPDGSGLEVFASGTRNHLDVPLDEHDRIFVRDNTDDGLGWWTRLMYLPPGGYMGYPWAYTRRPKETLPMIRDFGGGSPCGGWMYCDDRLPETYRGRIFHCEWGQGKVLAVKVAPDGAGFKFVDQIEFLLPNGVKDFRPFSLRPTADGRGFYVTDWGYSGWLNPARAGRLWKVTYTGDDVKPVPRGKDTDTIEQLVVSLGDPAHTERLRAQWALKARGAKAVPLLEKCLHDKERSWRARVGAMWVLAEIAPDKALDWMAQAQVWKLDKNFKIEVFRFLADERLQQLAKKHRMTKHSWQGNVYEGVMNGWPLEDDPAVQLFAARALEVSLYGNSKASFWLDAIAHLDEARLRKLEADPFVRAIWVRILRKHADWEENAQLPLWEEKNRNLEAERDHWEIVYQALAETYTLPALAMLKAILKAPDAVIRRRAVETLARNYKDRKPYAGSWWGTQPAGQKPPARVVAWEGTPKVREAILGALADRDAEVRKAAVAALTAANDPETLGSLVQRFGVEKDAAARADLVRAVAGLDTPKAASFLVDVVDEMKHPQTLRIEAIAGLEKFNTPRVVDSLSVLLRPDEPAALRVRALEALGALKAAGARPAVTTAFKSKEPAVRRAAVLALGKIGAGDDIYRLVSLLDDPEATVQVAAIGALAALRAKYKPAEKNEAITALLPLANRMATQFDAISALAQMPDKRALSAYLTGLASKNTELRTACRQAIAVLRDDVVPTLEQLAKRNEIPTAALAELREVYSSFAPILSWRLIGPFPRDGKEHPPQTEQKFDAVYKGADKDVKWQTITADAKQHGRVNLEARLRPNQQVVAYAYAEIESATARDATLLVGSDDTITIWLNDKKVHDFQGDRGWDYNQEKVNVHLEKGKNRLLIACGNSGGPWDFSVAVSAEVDRYAFLKGAGQKFDLETFRAFARKNPGDAQRGRQLFLDTKGLACVKCHAIAGQGGQVGPDLAGIGLRYKGEDLMTSILEPSKVIAQGYETIVVETKKGQTLTGVFKGESDDAVNLTDNEGKPHRITKKDIEDRVFSPVSTMLNGLSDGMTLQDFADLIAFLEARREEKAPPKN
jgi:putative heme-binding domain-containing protein